MHLNGTNKTPETGNKEMFVLLWIVSYIGVSLCSLMPSAANVVGGVGEKLVRRSRTLLSEGVVLFFTTCSVCLFFLLTRLLSNCWTNFHEIFTNRRLCSVIRYRWYPRKISPPPKKKMGGPKSPFLDPKFRLTLHGMRMNSGKAETTGISTISRLPSHPSLVKFGSG